jgi:SNF2-related domain
MAVSQQAIDRFLFKEIPYIPQFKTAEPDWLRATIFDLTGKSYRPKTQPRPHQLEGIAFALYLRRALLYYSMRLGKTLIALQWAEQLRLSGAWKFKGICICHAPIAIDVWVDEAERHSWLKVYPVRNQLDELIDALESDCDLIVIPWSGLQNIFGIMRQNRKGKNKLYPDLAMLRDVAPAFRLAIIDEIHSAKNNTTLRFRMAEEIIRDCDMRLGLSGTPFGRNPYDVWSQAYLIDGGQTLGFNYQFFEAAFGIKRKNRFTGKPEYLFDQKKQGLLEEKLSSLALSYKLEECQKVAVWPGEVNLRITGDQLNAYEECIDKLISIPDRQDQEIKAVFVRLRQISSGYLPFVDSFGQTLIHRFKVNAKLEWIREFMVEVQDAKASWILFHEFTETGRLLTEALEEGGLSYAWLHGATRDKTGVVEQFQTKQVQVIVVQSATGSLAIDLHMADVMTFYESPVSPIIRAQAEARPLSASRGDRPLLMDDLACSGVERKIIQFVRQGKDLMSEIIHERKALREAGGKYVRRSPGPQPGSEAATA